MRPINTCIWVNEDGTVCGNMVEGNTLYCGSHNTFLRKQAKKSNQVKVVTQPRKVSAKQAKQLQDYSVQRVQFLEENPDCQIKIKDICTGLATTVHHSAKRGKNLLNIETFIGGCLACHHYVEFVMSAEERRERGLLITKNDTV